MSSQEADLFLAFVRKSRNYVEFGAGGSTVLASRHVSASILSVDSSTEWLDKVRASCAGALTEPVLIHIDIGPTGAWGFPTGSETRERWPRYHEDVWEIAGSREADLYLVDGRFRVACFAQIVAHCSPAAIIGFHDFASRAHYHPVREVASAEDLSFFQPRAEAGEAARRILDTYRFDPA